LNGDTRGFITEMLETSMHKIGFVKVNYTEFTSELRIENKNMNNNLCNMLSSNKY